MATVSGQLKEPNVNGKPRDLSNLIYNIAPTDTPFFTMCGRTEATQVLHEWQTETLAAPAANAILEGADTSSYSEETSTELQNRCQILKKAISVSGTAQKIKQNGVSNQYNHQMANRMKEIKKDVEYALLSNQIAATESGTAARKLRGLPTWIDTSYYGGTGGSKGSSSAVCTAAAGTNVRIPTEAMLKEVIQNVYTNGGNPDKIMVAPAIRQKFSEVLGSGHTKMEKTSEKKVTSVVDVYVSDFGTLELVPNRVQNSVAYSSAVAFVLDPDYWKVAFLRGFKEETLSKIGDSQRGHILVELTLEACNEASSGMLADLKSA